MHRTTRHDRDNGAGLRIVVQNGEYWLRNNGDLAMLEVTIGRLRARWPQARIGVLTSTPSLLRAYFPHVEPISDGRFPALLSSDPVGRMAGKLGPATVGPGVVGWLHARQRAEQLLARVRGSRRRADPAPVDSRVPVLAGDAGLPVGPPLPLLGNVAAAIRGASLVLAMGGGYMTDVDHYQVSRTLGVLAGAIDEGVPTAMVGQGLGPLVDPGLVAHARRILPVVDVIGLREGLKGPALLADLDVPSGQVVVTGDDAIELAYSVRQPTMGSDLGICLRVADYSPVAGTARIAVSRAIQAHATEVGGALVPLIISEYRSEDRRSTMPLVEGFPRVLAPLGRFVAARDVAARVSRCRVLVTGAYHLAVFALSQGIPVVGLTASAYYDDKFLGLAQMFRGGLQLLRLDDVALEAKLATAIRTAWDEAPALRSPLQERAEAQIRSSRELYTRIYGLVGPGRTDQSGVRGWTRLE